MALEFSPAVTDKIDGIFAHVELTALNATIDIGGDKEFVLSMGPYHLRTLTGGIAERAGFTPEDIVDDEFLRTLAETPKGTVAKGLYLARHASGLLIMNTSHKVGPATGDVEYMYLMRTLRTTEHENEVVSARGVGSLLLQGDVDLRQIRSEYAERLATPAEFFGHEFSSIYREQILIDTVRANM